MNKAITTSNLFNRLNRFAIGYEPLFREFEKRFDITQPSYPPYNMIKVNDDTVELEIAVSGFTKREITLEQNKDQLIVSGSKTKPEDGQEQEYIHKGVSSKDFTLTWSLADYVEVESAELVDGMLHIILQRLVPEEEKSKLIEIK